MSLPHVLLGLLATEARTGYDLERAIREEIEPVWRADFSQIYPALARLRRAGFVLLRALGPRRGPRRNLYRVTAAGRGELKRWLAEPSPPPRLKDEGLTRIAFLDVLSWTERREALLRQERAAAEEIRRLRSSAPVAGSRGVARRGAIERLESTRRWIRTLAQETMPAEAPPESPGAGAKKK